MSARTFLCRETLWEAFEEIAREERAPIDDVLSDAMRAYARRRSYAVEEDRSLLPGEDRPSPIVADDRPDEAENSSDPARANRAAARTLATRPSSPMVDAPTMRRPSFMPVPLPSRVLHTPPSGPGSGLPAGAASGPGRRVSTLPLNQPLSAPPITTRGQEGFPSPTGRSAAPLPRAQSRPVPPPRSMPPPLPPSDPRMQQMPSSGGAQTRSAGRLSLAYEDQSIEVTKDRFIIGRSKSLADLMLNDPNVSRQHAAIERAGNEWFLADLGSTNGCYVDGQRVSRRPLRDGDVIEITTHVIRCSLR